MLDARQPSKVLYPLDELLSLLAVLADTEDFTNLACLTRTSLNVCAAFGPSYMVPGRKIISLVFLSTATPRVFQRCLVATVSALIKTPTEGIALDGGGRDFTLIR